MVPSNLAVAYTLLAGMHFEITSDCLSYIPTGVPVVHLISYPFPRVWHQTTDNANAIDWVFVSNFRKIMLVFLHEYFHLQ